MLTIRDVLDDPTLLGRFVQGPSWQAWRVFLLALFGLAGDDDDARVLFARCTGRSTWPTTPAREGWVIAGRRGGKSFIVAVIATFLAAFRDWAPLLAPGERATIAVIAADRPQARSVMRYITGLFDAVPMLARRVVRRTASAIELDGRVVIEVHTCSFRSVRGYSFAAVVADEAAFWRDESSATPDVEVLHAVRPGLASLRGLLLVISSPWARRGAVWSAYREHFGRDDDPVLLWKADTATMNPTIAAATIAAAYAADATSAATEFGAEFRSDLESYVSREVVEACTVPDRREILPASGVAYAGFADPSGGAGDSFTLGIGHGEDRDGHRVVVLDALREVRPPFNPSVVVETFADLLKSYGVTCVQADKYAGQWVVDAFAKHAVVVDQSAEPKSTLYANLLPLLHAGRCELLDDARLHAQLLALERRTRAGGRDIIDHPPKGHDDLANACAGAVVAASRVATGTVRAVNLADVPIRQALTGEVTYADEIAAWTRGRDEDDFA
jgi:hypothetical protein